MTVVGGTAQGMRQGNRTRIMHSGLVLKPGLPFEEWADVGRRLASLAHASAWSLGDWLIYGVHAYGRRYAGALEATRFDYQTLRNYAWVARAFEPTRRHPELSFGHHAEVAALPEPAQDLWLRRAETGRWSRGELRRQIRLARTGGEAEAPVVVRVPIRPEQERRWREAAAARRLAVAQWLAETADAAADEALAGDVGLSA